MECVGAAKDVAITTGRILPKLRSALDLRNDRTHKCARLAVEAAAASVLAVLLVRLAGTGDAYLAVISAVLVLQPDRDQTFATGGSRVVGTVVGSVVGGTALALAPDGAMLLSLALAMLIMGGIAAAKPAWNYGLVSTAALALDSGQGFVDTAVSRGTAIGVGVLAGVVVGLVIWPESAKGRVQHQLQKALSACSELSQETISAALDRPEQSVSRLHARFRDAISAAAELARSIRLSSSAKKQRLEEAVHRTERLWHALIFLDRVSETRQAERLRLGDETLEEVREIRRASCDALGCLARFEVVPQEDLDGLERRLRDLWGRSKVDPTQSDELEKAALIYGLREVARNVREVNELIPQFRG